MCKNMEEKRMANAVLSVFFTTFAKRQAMFGGMKTGFLRSSLALLSQKNKAAILAGNRLLA